MYPLGEAPTTPRFFLHTHTTPSSCTYRSTRSVQPKREAMPPLHQRTHVHPRFYPRSPFRSARVGSWKLQEATPCLLSTAHSHPSTPLPIAYLLPPLGSALGPSGGPCRAPTTPVHTQPILMHARFFCTQPHSPTPVLQLLSKPVFRAPHPLWARLSSSSSLAADPIPPPAFLAPPASRDRTLIHSVVTFLPRFHHDHHSAVSPPIFASAPSFFAPSLSTFPNIDIYECAASIRPLLSSVEGAHVLSNHPSFLPLLSIPYPPPPLRDSSPPLIASLASSCLHRSSSLRPFVTNLEPSELPGARPVPPPSGWGNCPRTAGDACPAPLRPSMILQCLR